MEKTLLAFSHFAKAIMAGQPGVFFSDYSPAKGTEFYFGVGDYEVVSFDADQFPVFSVVDWKGESDFNYCFQEHKSHEDNFELVAPDFLNSTEPIKNFEFAVPTDGDEWIQKVEKVIEAQARGDAWVCNLAHQYVQGELKSKKTLRPDILRLFYRFLCLEKSHSAVLVITNEQIICSMSPELFIRQGHDHILTSPIKGSGTKEYLNASAKEKSELDMVTDLLRNDLGQICESVSVLNERFLVAEKNFYSARSVIQGDFSDNLNWKHYQTLLPAGSISGAPKRRVVQLIESLETFDRQFYTGTTGVRLSQTESVWNILIRTLFVDLDKNTWSFPVGVGITAESDPAREWSETWQKAQLLSDLCR